MNRDGRSKAAMRLVRRIGIPRCQALQVTSSRRPMASDLTWPIVLSRERAIDARCAATESDRSKASAGDIASTVSHSNRTATGQLPRPAPYGQKHQGHYGQTDQDC